MTVTINETSHDVPFDFSTITLGKFLAYYEQYGRDLDKRLIELQKTDYKKLLEAKGFYDVQEEDIELHKSMDIDTHIDEEALAWFSFWTGEALYQLKGDALVAPLLTHYRLFRHLTNVSVREPADDFPKIILWNEDQWAIQDFRIGPQSAMVFNEVITAKEIMRQVHAIGKGKWDALPYLCAVFFRKDGEVFSDALIEEGGERMELMQQLPMIYALQVAFFLSISVNIWSNTSVAFPEKVVETPSPN